MRLIVFVVCISLTFGQAMILRNVNEFCNENTSEKAHKLSMSENITSPNYPEEYTPDMDCYIRRYTDLTHIKIEFFKVMLEPNYDELDIFEGLVSREEIESGQVYAVHTISRLEGEITLGSKVTLRLRSDESYQLSGINMRISPYDGDVDECADSSKNNCDANAHCHDVIGGFQCVCADGFTGDGTSCEDIDECADSSTHNCDVNAHCHNVIGGFQCVCADGFTGDGTYCEDGDVDECADSSKNNCDVNANCHDVIGGFQCVCADGFTGDGTSCADIDECTTNNHACSENSICTNIPGHYTCACKHGFQRNGAQCIEEIILRNVTELCNENTSEKAQKLSMSDYITSPNYPEEYPPNMDCYIRRYTDSTHLKIEFFDVALEPNYDELEIFNGLVSREDIESGQVYADHTISRLEGEITLGSKVTLRLRSDESDQYSGINMRISPYGS